MIMTMNTMLTPSIMRQEHDAMSMSMSTSMIMATNMDTIITTSRCRKTSAK